MTVLNDEPGTAEVLEILGAARREETAAEVDAARVLLPFMTLMELEYLLIRKLGRDEAQGVVSLIRDWPVELVESSKLWRREAARIKAAFPVSTADAWVSSLAILEGGVLVHKDPEFDTVEGLDHLRLPYKPKVRRR